MLEDIYSKIHPLSVSDVGVCYYCGCEAEKIDYAPSVKYLDFFLETRESAAYCMLPCCIECFSFLIDSREGLIENRKKIVDKGIKKKYKKALSIYERWSEDEISELSLDLQKSVLAGIELGKEAVSRINFPGFEYEIDGTIFHKRQVESRSFYVFGERFVNFRNALQYASRAYKININKLKELVMDHGNSFDDALETYFEQLERERLEKLRKKLSKEFATEHKQNVNFIIGALEAYEAANPELSLQECLDLIYEERIKR